MIRRRGKEFSQSTARRMDAIHAPTRIAGENGSMPVRGHKPSPPPIGVLYDELACELAPAPRYGQYPRGFIRRILPWLKTTRARLVHVCSGCLPAGEGIRVDRDPRARPDIVADARALPFKSAALDAVLLDPPYTEHYARELYGFDYPRPKHLLAEAARVVRPGGRIGIVHYITPKPPRGTRFVKAFGLSTGFDMPVRAVTIYEVDSRGLFD